MTRPTPARATLGALALLLTSVATARAQTGYGDEQRRLLEVRRTQVELREAQSELRRMEELKADGLVSQAELDRASAVVETAQLGYQQAVLALLAIEPWISVQRALKYQTPDGRRFVRLRVANLTPTFDDTQFQLLNNFEGADPIPAELRRRDVRDIFISLRDRDGGEAGGPGTAIALPYEVHIQELAYGATRTMEFQLLRDVDELVVATGYRGLRQSIGVQLQQAESERVVAVASTQISQEADLGTQATFDLRLERSSVGVRSYQLKVLNLPQQVTYSFVDPTSQARLSSVNFPAGVTQLDLGLRLFLPERADTEIPIDVAHRFWALAMDDEEGARFSEARDYTQEEIEATRAGFVELAVIPRGVGRIAVSAPSLFSEVRRGETVVTRLTLRNIGTRRLDNVKVQTEYPIDWRVVVEPDVVPTLDVNQEGTVELQIVSPEDIDVGDYEVRIRVESYADNRPVPTEDKIYRVSVKAPINVWGTLLLLTVMLTAVVGTVVAGIRITRR